jgi:hypothetical protein
MNHSTTSPISPTRSLRRLLTAAALTLGLAFSAVAITTSSASAASFGDVFVVATAHSNCGSHTITIWPMTNEYVNGQYSVYSYAQVYDYVSARWITTGWLLDNGVQAHVLYNFRNFYAYAKVTYARYMNGGWVYRADWVLITPDLDSQGVFCNP